MPAPPSSIFPLADTSTWRPCPACERAIPVVWEGETFTAVCPWCAHVALSAAAGAGSPEQRRCFGCETPLGGAAQCPSCKLPRGWSRSSCACCGAVQASATPHWDVSCNLQDFQCVRCERRVISLCVC